MEDLINELTEEKIVERLGPVERRLYSSSNREGQLKLLCGSKRVILVGEIAEELDKQKKLIVNE